MAQHAPTRNEGAASHEANQSPSVRTYVNIFFVLLAATAIEVAASWLSDVGVPVGIEIAVLIALAVIKGILVVMFYMHLRFDSRWFVFLFTTGTILAAFCVVVMLVLFSYHRGLVG